MGLTIPVSRIRARCFRAISTRFPPINLYEDVADPGDLGEVFALELLTNDRFREEAGLLRLVPAEDRVSGRGSTYIMAAFTHVNPLGSRFSDGIYGVFYAGLDRGTAIAETSHHKASELRQNRIPAINIEMRMLTARVNGNMHDIRNKQCRMSDVYDPDSYSASQPFGRKLRDGSSYGIVYSSVRKSDGDCIAVFRPPILSQCIQSEHLIYAWDGSKISDIFKATSVLPAPMQHAHRKK